MDVIEHSCPACGCNAEGCNAEFGQLREHYVGQANNREEEITRLEAQLAGAVEAIDAAYAALSGSQYVGGPTEREAFRTAMEKLQPFVTEHRGQ